MSEACDGKQNLGVDSNTSKETRWQGGKVSYLRPYWLEKLRPTGRKLTNRAWNAFFGQNKLKRRALEQRRQGTTEVLW